MRVKSFLLERGGYKGRDSMGETYSKLGATKDDRDFLLTAQGKTRTCDLVPSPLSVLLATRHVTK